MIIRTKLPSLIGAAAITAYPFILLVPGYFDELLILRHEKVHLEQQRRWAIWGLGVGLFVWFFLYLFALPFWFNPWRRRWETEAFSKAEGYDESVIAGLLRQPPYYLK